MKSVLFIHGGGEGAYAEDLKLASSLRERLGPGYAVRYPQMSGHGYNAWAERIGLEIASAEGEVALAGHSFGASVLLKYVAEFGLTKTVAGLFLVAPPFWGMEDWEIDEYELPAGFASKLPAGMPVFLYHSRGDEVVPFGHLERYRAELPQAAVRVFDGRGHQFGDDLSEVAEDIKSALGR